MKLSFDGIRMNLARAYNDLAATDLSYEQRKPMREIRQFVGGLLAAYDPRDQPDDCNMLVDRIELLHVPRDDDDED